MQLTQTNNGGLIRIAIVGAGEFGIQAYHLIKIINSRKPSYDVVGWFDDTQIKQTIHNGLPVLGGTDDISRFYNDGEYDKLFVAIGYNHPHFKANIIRNYKDKIPFISIISPEAYIDSDAELGVNVMIYPRAVVDKGCKIKDGVTLNLGVIISHDSIVDDYTFVAPGATVAGFSKIGKNSFVGAGATIIDNVSICDNCKIGAGAVVTKDINEPGTYVGIPAQIITKQQNIHDDSIQ